MFDKKTGTGFGVIQNRIGKWFAVVTDDGCEFFTARCKGRPEQYSQGDSVLISNYNGTQYTSDSVISKTTKERHGCQDTEEERTDK